jgi:hypothetical protein
MRSWISRAWYSATFSFDIPEALPGLGDAAGTEASRIAYTSRNKSGRVL